MLAHWEAPYCVPSTFWVRIFPLFPGDGNVDNPYVVNVQAFAGSWSLSITENRPLVLMLTSRSGAARQWNVAMSAGEGRANLTHTVAEDVHLQLAGNDYSSFVDMGSLNMTFVAGAATRYVFASATLGGTVDAPVRVRVEARDQYDNLAVGEQRSLWIAFNTSVVQIVDFRDGVGTALVSSTRPGSVEVTLRDPVHSSADISSTMTVHFTVGVVRRYAFVAPAVDTFTVGTLATISLAAEDQYGNLVESEGRGVSVVTSKGTGGGVASFTSGRSSTSVTHTVAEIVVLSLQDYQGTGLDVSSTLTIRFIGGPAYSVRLLASVIEGTVDAPLVVSLTALDRYQNLAAAATEAVQVVATGTVVSGGGTVSFSGGRASASISSQRAETVQVSLLDLGAGLDTSATVDLRFLAGAPTKFVLQAASSATVGSSVAVTVQAHDQYGNVAASSSQSVTVQASGAAQLPSGGVVSLSGGVATVPLSNTRAEQVDLTLQDSSSTGLDVSSRAQVVFTAASAARYVLGFSTAQTSSSVDGTIGISVTAVDAYGNTAVTEQRGVGLLTNASTVASVTPVTVTNGVGTATIGHTLPEILTLSLQDTQGTGLDVSSTLTVRFTAGLARSLAFEAGQPASGTVDAAIPVVIVALDQHGNVATGAASTDVELRLTGTQVGGAGRVTLTQGRGTASVTSQRPQTVPASLVDTYGSGLDVSSAAASLSFTFVGGVPVRVAMTAAASGTVGSPVTVTLKSFDQHGNEVATGSSDISVSASGQATVSNSGLAQLVNGAATVTVQNTLAETVTLSMQDSFGSGLDVSATQSLVFRAGPAARYAFASTRLQGSVDSPVQVDVQALDQFGNVAADQNVDVAFASSAGGAPTTVDISAGRGSAQVRHTVAEVVTLTLVDTLGTGLGVSTDGSLQITFAPSAATRVVLQAGATTGTVDAALQVIVRALDHHGNLATTENRAVELRKGGLTNLGRIDLSSGEGLGSVSSTSVGPVVVSLHDTFGTGLDCSSTITLTFAAGAPSRLVIVPQSGVVGDLVNITVKSLDQHGNEAPTGTQSVTVRVSGDAAVFGSGIAQLQAGSAMVFVRNQKAETVTLSMEDSFSTGLDVSDTKTMVFFASPATRFAFASVPSQVSVDNPAQISINAFDQYGNIATQQQADVGVQLSGFGSPSIVDIASGRGTLQVSRTIPQVVSLLLVDSQGTGLSVVGGSANVTFIAGAAHTIVFQPSTVSGTVDAALSLELLAMDQYGNLATSEGRSVEARTSAARVSGLGRVVFAQGRGVISVASELAQTVQVTLQDASGTGIDCSASASAVFGHGEIRRFRLADSTGSARAVAKVGRTVTMHSRAEDQYGNLVTNLTSAVLTGQISPPPPNGTNASLAWSITNGLGTQDIHIATAGIFSVQVLDAVSGYTSQAGILSAAADRSDPWRLEVRYDLVPPDYEGLNISSISDTEVVVNVNGLTELSTLWCVAADASSQPPQTPNSVSDGEVYAALRGGTGNVTSTPAARAGPFAPSGQLTLTGLEAGRTYAIRCAAADEEGNQMTGSRILEHQLAAAAPQSPTQAPVQATQEESWGVMFILGIVGVILATCLVCCAVAYFFRARNLMKKVTRTMTGIMPAMSAWGGDQGMESVMPSDPASGGGGRSHDGQTGKRISGVDAGAAATLAGEIDKSQQQDGSPSVYTVEDKSKVTVENPPNALDDIETEDEDGGGHDEELLRDALAMQQELMDELQRRDLEDDYDSTASDDSDTEAILRDVKAFLRQQTLKPRESVEDEPALVLPDLPLLLSSEDEARLSSLIALGQQDGASWEKRLANFDELWKDAQGQPWKEARELVRSQMLERQSQIEAARQQLRDAQQAVEQQAEAAESAILDALSAEEEAFYGEADGKLKAMHQLAIDWPGEDARERNAVVEEWAPKITAADHLPKAERAQIRKEAIACLRKLDDERENALEAELERFEEASKQRFEALREERAQAWRRMCEGSAQQAARLREEVTRLRVQIAALGRQAEEAALQAALQLRRRLRDDTIEAEMAKEAEEREKQLVQWRHSIQEVLPDDDEENAMLRERALAAIDRAAVLARKVAEDEQSSRKRHWHEILEERSRDRMKVVRRRYHDEERKLSEEAMRVQEEASEAEARRKVVLVLGALHRSEGATLAVHSAARRGRILMGLQATAAGSVAEERLPRKELPVGRRKSNDKEAQVEAMSATGMAVTGFRFQDAQRKAAEELNFALDQVAEILAGHGQQQRSLLAQRQRREATFASAPEGDDERREDLLDALEENMRWEVRAARWQHEGQSAEAMVRRGAGEESELGRRLAAVNRDSQLLSNEDEIGERYDRLRALVMGPGAEQELAAQRKAQALEREAAALRAEAMANMDLADSPQSAWDGTDAQVNFQGAPVGTTESRVEVISSEPDEQHRGLRQRRRQDALERARVLIKEGRMAEAASLLKGALEEEDVLEDSSPNAAADAMALTLRSMSGSDWMEDARSAAAGQPPSENFARRARRLDALAKADQMEASGKPEEAVGALLNALQEADRADRAAAATQTDAGTSAAVGTSAAAWGEGEESALDAFSEEDRRNLLQRLMAGQGKAADLVAKAAQEEKSRIETRRRRRKEALQKAKELETRDLHVEAAQLLLPVLSAERAEEQRETDGEVPSALDWRNLQDDLASRNAKIGDAVEEDARARRARLMAQRDAKRRQRAEELDKAKKLLSHGYPQQAVEVAMKAIDEKAEEEKEIEEAMLDVVRQSLEGSSMSEDERAKLMSKLSVTQEAIERAREEQRKKLEARRAARKQHQKDIQRQAQELLKLGQHREAAELVREALESEEAEERREQAEEAEAEASSMADVDWSGLKSDLAKRQGYLSADMAKEAEARREKLKRLREERSRMRAEAARMAKELEQQGLEKEAVELLVDAMKEDQDSLDNEYAVMEAALSPGSKPPRRMSDAERAQVFNAFAEGGAQWNDALASEAEDQRQKVEARRRARQQKREEAERHAEELEQQAADLRAEAAEKAKASRKVAEDGSGLAAEPKAAEFDAVTEWQEAARRRAAVGAVASFCQRGQENAARRLLDSEVSEQDRSALKDAFAAEMEKCGAAVADEREVQRRKARERLDERRKKREAAAERANKGMSKADSFKKIRNAVQHQIHGVHGLRRIHARRRQKIVEEHREVERRVREEMEQELEALRRRLQSEADQELQHLGQQAQAAEAASRKSSPDAMTEDEAKKAREAGMARTEEVKGLIQTERQRQAERIEARLAQRRNKLIKREAAVVQSHQWVEARVELDQERERLQAKPVSKSKNKELLKELHKVNNIIANLQNGGISGAPSPSPNGKVTNSRPATALGTVGARLVDVDGDLEGSEEEV